MIKSQINSILTILNKTYPKPKLKMFLLLVYCKSQSLFCAGKYSINTATLYTHSIESIAAIPSKGYIGP